MKTMKEYRDEVMDARTKFLRAFDRFPQHLFASRNWAEDVSLAWAVDQKCEPRLINGMQFFNMVIHIVPTLDGTFLIA